MPQLHFMDANDIELSPAFFAASTAGPPSRVFLLAVARALQSVGMDGINIGNRHAEFPRSR
jgi:hypothetical protein